MATASGIDRRGPKAWLVYRAVVAQAIAIDSRGRRCAARILRALINEDFAVVVVRTPIGFAIGEIFVDITLSRALGFEATANGARTNEH